MQRWQRLTQPAMAVRHQSHAGRPEAVHGCGLASCAHGSNGRPGQRLAATCCTSQPRYQLHSCVHKAMTGPHAVQGHAILHNLRWQPRQAELCMVLRRGLQLLLLIGQ